MTNALPPTGLSRLTNNQEKAVELLAAKGFGNVGLREMANALEVTAGAFYYHFAGKDDYLNFLLEAHYTELLAAVAISRSARPSLTSTVNRLVDLHIHRESYFILAAREFGRLQYQASDSAINALRDKINQHLIRTVDPTSPRTSQLCTNTLSARCSCTIWQTRHSKETGLSSTRGAEISREDVGVSPLRTNSSTSGATATQL